MTTTQGAPAGSDKASPVHSSVSPAKSQDLDTGDPIIAAAGSGPVAQARGRNKLTLFPLIFLIFFEVAGGPYGAEPAVLGHLCFCRKNDFLVFPLVNTLFWNPP
ncbi:unnamed protein product [Miscanthus lutarioriparius]|uniref:Uncharacterized protein n=1 Tax=Miscanthus lutarioriparius TaxID=422564 RepID=A0A811MA40_9POAL|nr:unnamed protein product [Miscanthus lutarioriparius]